MNRIKLGIIGIGNMGSGHASNIKSGKCHEIELVAIADINSDRLNWAKEQNEDKWYRNIEIKVKTSNDNVDRIYNFENVFILDYKEVYTTESETKKDYFKVNLTQKENNFKKIATF